MQKGFARVLLIILLLAVIVTGGIYAWFIYSPNTLSKFTHVVRPSLFSGKVFPITENLDLFTVINPNQSDASANPDFYYYSAGKYLYGSHAGYERIIALVDTKTPFGAVVYIFATKNRQTYSIDTQSAKDTSIGSLYTLSKNVTATENLETDQPRIISLTNQFALYRQNALTKYVNTGKMSSYGYDIQKPVLVTSLSEDYHILPQPLIAATIYAKKGLIGFDYLQHQTNSQLPNAYTLIQQYVQTTTSVYATDTTGLIYTYVLSTPQRISEYLNIFDPYNMSVQAYQDAYMKYQQVYGTTPPASAPPAPTYPSYPKGDTSVALQIDSAQIIDTNDQFYNMYNSALPQACGLDNNTIVANISKKDLTYAGVANGLTVYKLTDENHPLNKLQYFIKITSIQPTEWGYVNKVSQPTFTQYVSKNPLLFFQDNWGRWIVLGEYDYQLLGGCGKPVIYLYPKKPTNVVVRFIQQPFFTRTIPNYVNRWYVKAFPNGMLQDLQPEYTDCQAFDITHPGLLYAKDACTQQQYPYLYWSGNISNAYPQIQKGWVISQKDLPSFLDIQLTQLGLTSQEKTDMVSYWVPAMLQKNAPYYQISFLQTPEVNALFPLSVTPRPETIARIFLNWHSVDKPFVLSPQVLTPIVRKGFTLVEWGGLQQ